ncbi:MAG: class I SAM-dependent methyltransferase [Puniceicoccales bacterium]|jgi:hypothetical protein|nr:class I SAM-dependent methyltransferase [Puniceicoccales bacterium]
MKKWGNFVHGMVTIPLLLGCVSLSAVPKRVLVFGSNPAASGDEYHSCFFGGVLNAHPEAFYDVVGLAIQSYRDSRHHTIEFFSSGPAKEEMKESLEAALAEQMKDDRLAQILEEVKSKGAGVEAIKAIITKEAPSCSLGKELLLLLQGLGTEPNVEDTRRKVEEHHYTFVSEPPSSPDPLMSKLLHISHYPIAYIPCTVGTGEFLKLVQERGEGFDYIYTCDYTLHANSSAVISELILTLNPGGKLYISSENIDYDLLVGCYLSYLRLHGLTETHLDDKKATIREADYYTLTPPEREELDNVVLWNPRVENCGKRNPVNPEIKHHFQGKSNEYINETSKPLLIVTKDK